MVPVTTPIRSCIQAAVFKIPRPEKHNAALVGGIVEAIEAGRFSNAAVPMPR
jgi:hypothetical protein